MATDDSKPALCLSILPFALTLYTIASFPCPFQVLPDVLQMWGANTPPCFCFGLGNSQCLFRVYHVTCFCYPSPPPLSSYSNLLFCSVGPISAPGADTPQVSSPPSWTQLCFHFTECQVFREQPLNFQHMLTFLPSHLPSLAIFYLFVRLLQELPNSSANIASRRLLLMWFPARISLDPRGHWTKTQNCSSSIKNCSLIGGVNPFLVSHLTVFPLPVWVSLS